MIKRILIVLAVGLVTSFVAAEEVAVGLVPKPVAMKLLGGSFKIDSATEIVYDGADLERTGKQLSAYLEPAMGFALKTKAGRAAANGILITTQGASEKLGDEGYVLSVHENGIVVKARTAQGAFYGIQSIRQLLPVAVFGDDPVKAEWTVPCLDIADMPRFSWRAFMLDEGRYFKGMAVVKDILEEMALLKMNVYHWHLVDDQGWRIEIKKYPKLTEIGSKRPGTSAKKNNETEHNGIPHEGFYTQEQIKEIVKYAADLHISVIPEIEMPGHASASIAAYPEMGSTDEKVEVPVSFGRKLHCYNVADQKVYDMLVDILDETIALFPADVLHIGGDEVNYSQWDKNAMIQEYMAKHGLKDGKELQVHFLNRMSKTLESKGRRMMGWNEILGIDEGDIKRGTVKEVELSKKAIIHFWKGDADLAKEAAKRGYDVVNSLHHYTYLDYNFGRLTLQKAYEYDPMFEGLEPQYHKNIIGIGCQMWGETIPGVKNMQLKMHPRMLAFAEMGWTPQASREYYEFEKRIDYHCQRYQLTGVAYVTGQGRNSWRNKKKK